MDADSDQAGQRITYEARVVRIVERAPDTRSLFLQLPASSRFTFVPGQFISCLLPLSDPPAIRPYSIASDPEDAGLLEICLNLVPGGSGSPYLFSLDVGDPLRFTGPWGTFTLERQPQAECVFIAEGTGIAPIRPMLHRALASDSSYPVRLHYAAPRVGSLLYAEEFERAAVEYERFTFVPLLAAPLIETISEQYIACDDDRRRHFYICGVGDVVPQLRDLLRRSGYARRAVQYEKW